MKRCISCELPPSRSLLLAIVLIAGCARASLFIMAPHVESPDTAEYIASGNALFLTGRMASVVYMPLYPILIHLAGYNGVIWVQIALSTVTVLLVRRLALAIWDNELAGLSAALACALHPLLLYFSIARLTETVAIFFLVLGLVLLYRRRILLGSVALVLLNLTRPSFDFILLLIVATATFAVEQELSWSLLLRRLSMFSLVYIVLMTPWWAHNLNMYGQFVRLDLADGITLILENSESYEQHGFDWSVDPPWAPFSNYADPVAKNDAMKRAAFDYIRRKPLTWLAASCDRFRRFFTPWPTGLTEHTTRFLSEVAVKTISAIAILPIFVGALVALAAFRERWRVMSPLILVAGYLTALHVATYALWRYRIPIDPLLIAMAAGPLAALAGRLWPWLPHEWAKDVPFRRDRGRMAAPEGTLR